MKNLLLAFCFVVLLCRPAAGQTSETCFPLWTEHYYPINPQAISADNSGYSIIVYGSISAPPYGANLLQRYDRSDKLLWQKNLDQSGYSYFVTTGYNGILLSDGGKVIKYDVNGNTVFNLALESSSVGVYAEEDAGGNTYVAASRFLKGDGTFFNGVYKLDAKGTIRLTMPVPNMTIRGVRLNSDGSLLVGGTTTESGKTIFNYAKLKTDGTIAFNLKINPLYNSVDLVALESAQDGYYFLTNQYKLPYGSEAHLYKTDFNGVVTKTTKIPGLYDQTTSSSLILADKLNPIIAYQTSNSANVDEYGSVIKFNSAGVKQWEYQKANQYWDPGDFQFDDSGNLIVRTSSSVFKLSPAGTVNYQYNEAIWRIPDCDTSPAGDLYIARYDPYGDHQDCLLVKYIKCTSLSITTQPLSKAVCVKGSTELEFVVNGREPNFQWKKNGNVIHDDNTYSGTQLSKLTISNANTAELGDYTCVATDNCLKEVTSAVAKLTLVTPLSITTDPVSKSICLGSNVQFATAAAGGTNIKYQWKKNGVGMTDGGTISGTKTNTLAISATIAGDAASYSCDVVNDCAVTLTTLSAILTVSPVTQLTKQPVVQTSIEGGEATFSVEASGTGLTYQWKKNNVNLTSATKYPGFLSPVLTVKAIACSDPGNYSCTVTGSCGPAVNSNAVALTVSSPISFVLNPSSQKVCAGQNTTLVVQANGARLTYSWMKGTTPLSDGGHFSGTKTSVLTISAVTASEAGSYSCLLAGGCSATLGSSLATLDLVTVPVINTQSANTTVCKDEITKLFVSLSEGDYTYQWLKGGAPVVEGQRITGSTSATLFIISTSESDAGSYSCKVSGCGAASATSNPISLSVDSKARIDIQPAEKTFCQHDRLTLSIGASGSAITYQWLKSGNPLLDNATVTGSTSSSLVIKDADYLLDEGFYSCRVAGSCGAPVSSVIIHILGNNKPDLQLLGNPDCLDVSSGTGALFTDANGLTGDLTFYGENESVPLPGFEAMDKAGIYNVIKTTAGNCSDTLKLTIGCVVTGIDPAGNQLFTVSPNPTKGVFKLHAENSVIAYEILDAHGFTVLNGPVSYPDQEVCAGHLTSGLYTVLVTNRSGSTKSQKIIIIP